DAGCPDLKRFAPDPYQHAAIHAVLNEGGKHILLAGPGAGKTTTVCNIAYEAAQRGQRVHILAFNREAESTLTTRMKTMQGKIKLLSKETVTENVEQKGILILTFDKYVHTFRTKPHQGAM